MRGLPALLTNYGSIISYNPPLGDRDTPVEEKSFTQKGFIFAQRPPKGKFVL